MLVYFFVGGVLVIGSVATLVPKFLFAVVCSGEDAALHAPIFAGMCVFAASSLCTLVPLRDYYIARSSGSAPAFSLGLLFARLRPLFAPALLSAIGTILQLLSLLFLPAAVLAGLRGFFILWTAQLSARLGLKDSPGSLAEWRCIYGCCAGACLVGLGAVFTSSGGGEEGGSGGAVAALGGSEGATAVGLLLSLLGYAFASGQVALGQSVFLWNATTGATHKLLETVGVGNIVT